MKLILLIAMCAMLASCQRAKLPGESEESWNYNLIELTFDCKDESGRTLKKTHQYIRLRDGGYQGGLCHYPECKYCKEKANESKGTY